MNADLLAAYPTVQCAVAWVETFVCQPPSDDPLSAWDEIMAPPTPPPNVVVAIVRESVADDDYALAEVKARVVAEMGRPEFATYVAGRMGSC